MIRIDGSLGEGGGQVLRTSLSLSMITGEALRIENIRAKRKKPGLMRQHLTAVRAAAEISRARVDGDVAGSTELEFKPGSIRHGDYHFTIGTAGSATLVLQTILSALLVTEGSSTIVIEGGTHNPLAPPFDFLDQAFLPLLRRMGAEAAVRLHRHGFFPAGGGKLGVEVSGSKLAPIDLTGAKKASSIQAKVIYACLGRSIAVREASVLRSRLGLGDEAVHIGEFPSAGPGNAVMVDVASEIAGAGTVREVFTAFGEKGVGAEKVAELAAGQALEYRESPAAVGRNLADQLLLPMALAGGGAFTALSPSLHCETNMAVIRAFLPGSFDVRESVPGSFVIEYKE